MFLYSDVRAVPMDLKDFHIQFGPTNHKSLMDCLLRRVYSIRDEQIRAEITYILRTLKDELSRGKLFLIKKTPVDESLETAYSQLNSQDRSKTTTKFDERERFLRGNKIKEMSNMISFDVENGLISGWKLTSLMGSIYNNTLNNYCNFWHLNKFGLIPTNYITQGDDTHFKCRFLGQALFHIGLVNGIGKIAHPNKQFFSLGMTEFLKKTYDLFDQQIYYSPCRMISSILYEKENRKSKANNKNNMKDIIDIWNLFLVRIPDQARRNHIKNQLYAQKCVRIKFKWHTQNYDFEDMKELFSTPSNYNGYLLGPLTEKNFLVDLSQAPKLKNIGFTLYEKYFDAKMEDFVKATEPISNEKHWIGIKSYSTQLVTRALTFTGTAQGEQNRNQLKSRVHKLVFESLKDGLREFREPKKLGNLELAKEGKYDQLFIAEIDKVFPQIEQFFIENMKFYLDGHDMATPWGQLMVMNNKLSNQVYQGLREVLGAERTSYRIYQSMSGLKENSKFTLNVFSMLEKCMTSRTLFNFALNEEVSCSICRFVKEDEYLGMLHQIINESVPLIFAKFIDFDRLILMNFPHLLKSQERKEATEEMTENDKVGREGDDELTRDKVERQFIDVLLKVIEAYLFLNHQKLWKPVKSHADFLVNSKPF